MRSRALLAAAAIASPALAALGLVLIAGRPDGFVGAALMALVLALTATIALSLRPREPHRLRTLGTLADALRDGDYGVRVRPPAGPGGYAELAATLNALADHLQRERHDLHETLQLLSKTLAGLDGAVLTFEADGRLKLINPAGARLLGADATALVGRTWSELGLGELMRADPEAPASRVRAYEFPARGGRWQITHSPLRSRSLAGHLLVVQPIEQALREEETQAFERLLRVLGHEINNSMTPIISLADTLQRLIERGDAGDDVRAGLRLIGERAQSLQRFIAGYAALARLPRPQPHAVSLRAACTDAAALLDRCGARIVLDEGDDLRVRADRDQLQQALINLLRNAAEAGGEDEIRVRWSAEDGRALVRILDRGHGLPASDNLFVPFFTTKPEGSGIGLVLSRQIVEAQGGRLSLRNRDDGHDGAVAELELPLWAA
ncbi:ATP-binding protein [Lysobacter yananisis]|uniref:histidine kinase n=1 Tax=Lysobacter yananisis TaxID=1003114 RepID=A0ABY9PF19_9GAMM|nr:ATP-binding protein [Lysobacter yananisis]WMT05524.1 ATP-binding protein [Lysobacter yananisis]